MKAQKPAEGILKTGDWGDSMMYHVRCDCTNDDHSHDFEVEADDHGVTVNIYIVAQTKFWEKSRWLLIWELLTKGYSEFQATIIMKEQAALNYAETLKVAAKQAKAFKDSK